MTLSVIDGLMVDLLVMGKGCRVYSLMIAMVFISMLLCLVVCDV